MSGHSFQFFYLIDLFLKYIYHRIFQFATHRPGGGNRLRRERARLSQPGAQLRSVGETVGERPVCRGTAQYRALRDRLVESAGSAGGRLTAAAQPHGGHRKPGLEAKDAAAPRGLDSGGGQPGRAYCQRERWASQFCYWWFLVLEVTISRSLGTYDFINAKEF